MLAADSAHSADRPDAAVRVVIIDDSLLIRERLTRLLESVPWMRVAGRAGTVAEGLVLIRRLQPDAVVLDLALPDGSGLDVLEATDRQPTRPACVVLSDHADEEYERRCLGLGAAAVLRKSTGFHQLVDRLTDAVAVSRPRLTRAVARRLVAAFPGAVLLLDGAGVVEGVSAAAERLLGANPGALAGRSIVELVHDEDRTAFMSALARCRERQGDVVRQGVQLGNGVAGWSRVDAALAGCPGDGTLVGTLLSLREAHAVVEPVDAKVRDAVYLELIEEAPAAMLLLEADGRILGANARACDLLGAAPAELLGSSVIETFLPCERGRVGELLEQLSRGAAVRIERELLRRDGARILVESSARRLPDGRIQSIVHDLSARRSREERQRQAQKMEALGELTGGIAHDFNNVLTVILAHIGLLEAEGMQQGAAVQSLADLRSAAMRGAAMVRRLTGFARAGSLELRSMDVGAFLTDARRTLRRILPDSIAIDVDLAASLPSVRADETAVEQILLNLATNARDAMPDGGSLRVMTRSVSVRPGLPGVPHELEAGQYVVLRVVDTGHGMDEATRRRIFEPFFTTKARDHGTGLGMPMVQNLVSQHRGAVRVESAVGTGTAVELFFPAVSPDAAANAAPGNGNGRAMPRRAVLLVEDDVALRRLVRRGLESHGFQVIEAGDGEEGLRRFHSHRAEVHVIVSEISLPRLDGVALFSAVRASDNRIPFVFASGRDLQKACPRVKAAPGVTSIRKPWTIEALVAAITQATGGGVARSAP